MSDKPARTQQKAAYAKRTGYAAQAKYSKDKTTSYHIKVNNETETDINAKLQAEPNINGYIKGLIRADIEKEESDNDGKM